MKYPRSPHEKVGGIVYFGRMLDKIRLKAADDLPSDLHQNLGAGFDKRCVDFLHVSYQSLVEKVKGGASDTDSLEWAFATGRKPTDEEIAIWNEFMRKRGWNDEVTETLDRRKRESNLSQREDIQTMFDYIDADEGRSLTSEQGVSAT
jgi:gluconokinase